MRDDRKVQLRMIATECEISLDQKKWAARALPNDAANGVVRSPRRALISSAIVVGVRVLCVHATAATALCYRGEKK